MALCECGCGQEAGMYAAPHDPKKTGKPRRFIHGHHNRSPLLKRFNEKWRQDEAGCHVWIGALGSSGYGAFRLKATTQKAHRVAYELAHGPIPDGLHVHHRCDNRPCVNPDHLFLGTSQDNMDDMWSKGRGATGQKVGGVKLTAEKVLEIKKRYSPRKVSMNQLAQEYGVSWGAIRKIVAGETWKWVQP